MKKVQIKAWLTQNALQNEAAGYFLEHFDGLDEAALTELNFLIFESDHEEKKKFQTQKIETMKDQLARLKQLTVEAKKTIMHRREANTEAAEEAIEADLLSQLQDVC